MDKNQISILTGENNNGQNQMTVNYIVYSPSKFNMNQSHISDKQHDFDISELVKRS